MVEKRKPKTIKRVGETAQTERFRELSGGTGFIPAGSDAYSQYQSEFPTRNTTGHYRDPYDPSITRYQKGRTHPAELSKSDILAFQVQQQIEQSRREQEQTQGRGFQTPQTQVEQKRSVWEIMAGIGLAPAALIANLLTGGLELITGEKYGRQDPFKLVEESQFGKALGLATLGTAIAAGAAMMASMLIPKAGAALSKGALAAKQLGIAGRITHVQTLGAGPTAKVITYQRALSALGNPAASKVSLLFQAAKNMGPTATQALLKMGAAKKIGLGLGALSATSGIMTWLASDNIMQGISIHVRDLPWAVRNGTISREEALSAIAEMQEWKNYAEGFVKVNSKVNPVLWPFGKVLLINAKKVQRDLDLKTQEIIFAGMEGMQIR